MAVTAPSTRARAHAILRYSDTSHASRRWRSVHLFVLGVGLLAIAISSTDGLPNWLTDLLTIAVVGVAMVFTAEYGVRLWSARTPRFAGLSDSIARLRGGLANGVICLLAALPLFVITGSITPTTRTPGLLHRVGARPDRHAPAIETLARVISNERATLQRGRHFRHGLIVRDRGAYHGTRRPPKAFGNLPDSRGGRW